MGDHCLHDLNVIQQTCHSNIALIKQERIWQLSASLQMMTVYWISVGVVHALIGRHVALLPLCI